ncbi:hypothetical protein [Streptomyces sp. NBC_01264]|uniref:hypothetical protein n=1 Tax=Streptomyces sp. NBC_01264 TaxID=2903804 RepID=UPI00224E1651|nr:hypothetical protein [Streptomyces sp. NBC_01264]MCX4776629.1 hypothetical protein [Streptomyces sp. NBC_01264]
MADTEDTPHALPNPADLRPVGPAQRWIWLLGGLAAGAAAITLALSLAANLVEAAPAAAPTTAATVTGGPETAPYTKLVDGCALLRPETVERYIKGATCTAQEQRAGEASSNGMWTSMTSGYAEARIGVGLSPFAEGVYQQTLTISRNMATTTGAKITDDRAVPDLGDKATLLYTSYSGYGRAKLSVVRNNALVTVEYSASTYSGLTRKDVPVDTAEAAAIACAKDVLGTLATP